MVASSDFLVVVASALGLVFMFGMAGFLTYFFLKRAKEEEERKSK